MFINENNLHTLKVHELEDNIKLSKAEYNNKDNILIEKCAELDNCTLEINNQRSAINSLQKQLEEQILLNHDEKLK